MLTTLVIALREFLEAFLIIGVFLGINRKLGLNKGKEIMLASLIGLVACLVLPIFAFYFSSLARPALTERNGELLEGYLLIFSGIFITYVVFSLHQAIHQLTDKKLLTAHHKLENRVFDISLFLLIVFFILREGFEIALFTASTSLFSTLIENLAGLILGFSLAATFGLMTYLSYLKMPIRKIYKLTEWLIVLLGGSMIINGINEFLEVFWKVSWADFLPIKILFLPSEETFLGHFLKSFFALQRDFSLLIVFLMISYIFLVKRILLGKKTAGLGKN